MKIFSKYKKKLHMPKPVAGPLSSEDGIAAMEAAFAIVLFIFLGFGVIEFGSMFNERIAVTSLAREGASLASRNLTTNQNMLDLLESTDGALDLPNKPTKYKIFLAQINGGPNALNPDPTCVVTERGGLTAPEVQAPTQPNCDLPNNLYNYLKYDASLNAPAVSQFTVVKVYYQHTPLTPLGNLSGTVGGTAHGSKDLTMSSTAIF